MLHENYQEGIATKWCDARSHFIEDDTERVQVATLADRFSGRLLMSRQRGRARASAALARLAGKALIVAEVMTPKVDPPPYFESVSENPPILIVW